MNSRRDTFARSLLLALCLLLGTAGAQAQPLRNTDSQGATRTVELRGEVVAFDFTSPVTRILFEVESSDGSTTPWTAETLSAVELRRHGWTSNSLVPGEMILVRGQIIDSLNGRIALQAVERVNGERLTPGTSNALSSLNPGRYNLVPGRIYLRLAFDHQGFSMASFWFSRAQAGISLAEGGTPSDLQVDLLAEDLESGSAELTRLLKSNTLFAASNYPVISYSSDSFSRVGNNRFLVEGQLTVKGVTRPVQLVAVINKTGIHPLTGNPGFGISARGTLDRAEWELAQYAPDVGLEVQVEIEAEFELGL